MYLSIVDIKASCSSLHLVTEAPLSDNSRLTSLVKRMVAHGLASKAISISRMLQLLSMNTVSRQYYVLDDKSWDDFFQQCVDTKLHDPKYSILLHLSVLEELLDSSPSQTTWNGLGLRSLELKGTRIFVMDWTRDDEQHNKSVPMYKGSRLHERVKMLQDDQKRLESIRTKIMQNNGLLIGEHEPISSSELIVLPAQPLSNMKSFSYQNMKRQQELISVLAKGTIPRKSEDWIRELLAGGWKSGSLLYRMPSKPLEGLVFYAPQHLDNSLVRENLGKLGARVIGSILPGSIFIPSTEPSNSLQNRELRIFNVNVLSHSWLNYVIQTGELLEPDFVQVPFLEPFNTKLDLSGYRTVVKLTSEAETGQVKQWLRGLGASIISDPGVADVIIATKVGEKDSWKQRARSFQCIAEYAESNLPHEHCPPAHFPTEAEEEEEEEKEPAMLEEEMQGEENEAERMWNDRNMQMEIDEPFE